MNYQNIQQRMEEVEMERQLRSLPRPNPFERVLEQRRASRKQAQTAVVLQRLAASPRLSVRRQRVRSGSMGIVFLLIVLTLLILPARGQSPEYGAVTLLSLSNAAGVVPEESAMSCGLLLDVRRQAHVSLEITAASDTGGGAIELVLAPTIDAVSYGEPTTVSFTPGQTATTIITNISTWGAGYLKLSYITNDSGAALTNISVKYAVQILRY